MNLGSSLPCDVSLIMDVAREARQHDPLNQDGLRCSCEQRGSCFTCILKRMGSLSGSSLHTVAPIGRHVCERCYEQTADCISSDHKKCLCPSCSRCLIDLPPGILNPLPRGLYSPTPLNSSSRSSTPPPLPPGIDSPPDSQTSLNPFPPMIHTPPSIRSGSPNPKERRTSTDMREMYEEIKDFLGKFEAKYSRSEHQPQASLPKERRTETEDVQMLLKEIADIKFENRELRNEMQLLKRQLQEEQNIQSVSQMKKAFKKQLNKTVEKLKDVTHNHASETARRMAGVIPLIKEIDFEGTWLNRASSEEFMELALLGVEDWVDPATIRKVVRHCVCIAKSLGPSYCMAEFARRVSRRIRQCPQLGLQLVGQYYGVYKRVKDDVRGKDALIAVLELLDKRDAAEHVIEIFHHLNKLIRVEKSCEFTIAASAYFQRESFKSEEWCKCLTNIPEFRSERHRPTAEKCLSDFLHAVCDGNFSEDYLLLAKLLSQRDDSLPVFEVVERLAEMMKSHENIWELRRVVEGLLVFMEAGNHSHVDAAFSLLIHLLRDPQREELQLLAEGIQGISGREGVAGLFAALVQVLGRVQSQDTTAALKKAFTYDDSRYL